MITDPFLIILVLLAVESFVLFLAEHPKTSKFFSVFPFIFWIYVLPMILSSFRVIDHKSEILPLITQYFLPASLFLLFVDVQLKPILRLGPKALGIFFVGSFGIMLGVVVSFFCFKGLIGAEFWSGFGTISASWTGGSSNMIAVKEALSTPDNVFMPMLIVDATTTYSWMAVLMALSSKQEKINTWIHRGQTIQKDSFEDIGLKIKNNESVVQWIPATGIVVFSLIVGIFTQWLAGFLPVLKNVISATTWTIILVTFLGIFSSFTPLRKLEHFGATKIGYLMLYFVLTSVGAKANFSHFNSVGILFLAGLVIIVIHASVLLLAMRWMRLPLYLVATASQANIGGVASTPIVAEVYKKGMAPVGLLLAVLGGICGTYIGIATGQICRLIAGG